MKRFVCVWTLAVGIALGLGLAVLIRTKRPAQPADAPSSPHKTAVTISLSAVIDGSDRFIFTRDNVWNEHGRWQPPQNVVFNGEPWDDLSAPPASWLELAKDVDLGKSVITMRKGRDVIALEPTAEGFDMYFADTPMGSAIYEVTISIPRK